MKTNGFTLSFQQLSGSVLLFVSPWKYDPSVFRERDPQGGWKINDTVYKDLCERGGIDNIETYGRMFGLPDGLMQPVDKNYIFSFIDLSTMRLLTLTQPRSNPANTLLYFAHEDIAGVPGAPLFRKTMETFKSITQMLGVSGILDPKLTRHVVAMDLYKLGSCYICEGKLEFSFNLSQFGSMINDEDHGIYSLK